MSERGFTPQQWAIESRRIERGRITPAALELDNHSMASVFRRRRFQNAKDGESLILDLCSDARMALFTQRNVHPVFRVLRSIAVASPTNDLKYVFTNTKDHIVVGPHFAGSKVKPKSRVELDCGGAKAKAAHIKGELSPEAKDIIKYLAHIDSHDVVTQSFIRSLEMAQFDPNKKVLSTVIDHETGLVIPIALIQDGGRSLPILSHPLDAYYDQSVVFEKGVPFAIPPSEIPSEFREFIEYTNRVNKEMKGNPLLLENQKVQNPNMVILTMNTIPEGDRYPTYCSQPNSTFNVIMPFVKVDKDITDINPKALDLVMRQLWYSLYHSAHAKPREAFSNTKTLLIETKDMKTSEALAINLLSRRFGRQFVRNGGEIIVGEVVTIVDEQGRKLPGHTNKIDYFYKQKAA